MSLIGEAFGLTAFAPSGIRLTVMFSAQLGPPFRGSSVTFDNLATPRKASMSCATATSMDRGSVTDPGARPGKLSTKETAGCNETPPDGAGLDYINICQWQLLHVHEERKMIFECVKTEDPKHSPHEEDCLVLGVHHRQQVPCQVIECVGRTQ